MALQKCLIDIDRCLTGDYPHSTELLLASGKDLPFDAGDYRLCTSAPVSNVSVYFLAKADLILSPGTQMPMAMGICIPRTCEANAQAAIDKLRHFLPRNVTIRNPTLQLAPTDVQPWDAGATVAVVLIGMLAVCCVIGALVSLLSRRGSKTRVASTAAEGGASDEGHAPLAPIALGNTNELAPLFGEGSETSGASVDLTTPSTTTNEPLLPSQASTARSVRKCGRGLCGRVPGLVSSFFLHFDPRHNGSRMLSVPAAKPTDVLNGMRVLSMLWIVLGHTFVMPEAISGYANPLDITALGGGDGRHWTFQLILGAEMAVDTFFFLSAFLFGHAFLGQVSSSRRLPSPMLMYLHRYLRLTPVMAFWLLLFYKLAPQMGEGPFWAAFVHSVTGRCDTSWWSQLLYIQNFYPWDSDDVCMGWTWYLGNDFLFYAISPFLVYIYAQNSKNGWRTLAGLLVCSFISSAMTVALHGCGLFILHKAEYDKYTYWLYSKPWHRIPPWLVGLGTAYIWREHSITITSTLQRRADLRISLTCGSLMLMFVIVLAPATDFVNGDEWKPGGWANVFYLTFARALWGVGCALFSVGCFAQPTSPIASFLGAGFWAPLARLTYGAYLTHPIVIKLLAGTSTEFYNWSYVDLTSRWLLNSILAYVLAAGAFLLVEKPFMNLEAKLFERRKPK